ncbi:MAG: LacI family DNA-binding transcriptional regulator [Caldilineaceae bacterium]|nr:LacI family DNA-binding transcriptional regulator [Caldilineaceae bacterium]
MSATMDDVAKYAAVSKSTVSLALNDKPGISPALKAAVIEAADALGYQHPKKRQSAQRAAQSTPTAAAATPCSIAIVHAQSGHKAEQGYVPTDLYLNYLTGIKRFAEAAGLQLTIITDYDETDRLQLAFHLVHNDLSSFDGIILMGGSASQNSRLVTQILEQDIPAVALSRVWPELPISTVGPNYYQQVRLALEHLLGLGHRQIGFVARDHDRRFEWFRWRLDAYQAIMRKTIGDVDKGLIAIGTDGAATATELLTRRPDVTAIFAINDECALEVFDGAQRVGRQIPQQLSVVGQDNVIELMGDTPMLTTVGFPHKEVGALAAELLLHRLRNPEISHCNLWVQCALVLRTSCAQPACDKPAH